MQEHWKAQQGTEPEQTTTTAPSATTHAATNGASIMLEFSRHRLSLVSANEEGWQAELRRYLGNMPTNVLEHTDIVKWWQVHLFLTIYPILY
jgi:hypothetical protein